MVKITRLWCYRMIMPLVVACFAAASAKAGAAVDCNRTAEPIEKVICGDADLARQDEHIAKALVADERAMPPALRESLQRGQQRWLKLRDLACSAGGIAVSCLQAVLAQREAELTAKPASNNWPAATFLNPPLLKNFPYSGATADLDVERLLDNDLALDRLGMGGNVTLVRVQIGASARSAEPEPAFEHEIKTCRDWLVLHAGGWSLAYGRYPGAVSQDYDAGIWNTCYEIEVLRVAHRPSKTFLSGVKLDDTRLYSLRTLNRFANIRQSEDPIASIADSPLRDLARRGILRITTGREITYGYGPELAALPNDTVMTLKAHAPSSLYVEYAHSRIEASGEVEAAFDKSGLDMILYSYGSIGLGTNRPGGFLFATKRSSTGAILPLQTNITAPGVPYP
jgi:uncharacterized protein